MKLESMIQNESCITLDCVKARIAKGTVIEIDDKHWSNPEVQGAIKLGFVRLIGKEPTVVSEAAANEDPRNEPKKTFVSTAGTRMAFECATKYKDPANGTSIKWKDYVDPGKELYVPLSAVSDKQIQNALAWGMLKDPDAKVAQPKKAVRKSSAKIEETKITADTGKSNKKKVSRKRIKAAPAPQKAKSDKLAGQPSSGFMELFGITPDASQPSEND